MSARWSKQNRCSKRFQIKFPNHCTFRKSRFLLKNGTHVKPAYSLGYENAPNVALDENDKTIGKISKNEPLVIYQDAVDYWVNEEIQAVEREALQKLNSQLLLPIGVKNELAGGASQHDDMTMIIVKIV